MVLCGCWADDRPPEVVLAEWRAGLYGLPHASTSVGVPAYQPCPVPLWANAGDFPLPKHVIRWDTKGF